MMQTKNIKLETSRLFLVPLNYDQLLLYGHSDTALELELGVLSDTNELSDELITTIDQFMIPYIINNPESILYATIWVVILKARNRIIGDIGFKGAPSDKGLIEIGYGTYPDFRNHGLMTEAVGSITGWAFSQPEVQIILAETDKANIASQKILNKNQFQPFAETEKMYWWRLDKSPQTL